MGPGQGGSLGDGVGRKELFKGGHWAQAREGPRTISPKRGHIRIRLSVQFLSIPMAIL